MIPFKALNTARFRCQADFAHGAVLNVDFAGLEAPIIPFHVSLRRDERLIVFNRRDPAGWRREVRFAHDFTPGRVTLTVSFSRAGASVEVDGRRFGPYGPRVAVDLTQKPPLRRGFPALDLIARVAMQGAVLAETVEIDCPGLSFTQSAQPGVHLGPRLSARLVVPRGHRASGAVLELGAGVEIPVLPDGDALSALIPGWVWRAGADQMVLRLRDAQGQTLGQMALEKEAVRARIAQMAAQGVLEMDRLSALQALEHVQHGALLPGFAPPVQRQLLALAQGMGAGAFLTGPTAVPQTAAIERDDQAVHAAYAAFLAATATGDTGDPARAVAVVAKGLTPHQKTLLAQVLTDWFCTNGDLNPLAALVTPSALHAAQGAWHASVNAPLLYVMGDYDGVRHALEHAVHAGGGQPSASALGWVGSSLARNSPARDGSLPGVTARDRMLGAFLTCVEARVPDYWAPMGSTAIIGAVVDLIGARLALGAEKRSWLLYLALRGFSLSPTFWQRLEQQEAPAEIPELAPAWQAFRALHAALGASKPTADIGALLAPFAALGAVGIERFTSDLLGPRALSQPLLPTLRAPDALRWVLHPLTPDTDKTPPRLAQAAQAARAVQHALPADTFRDLRQQASDLCDAALAQDAPPVDALADALLPLCEPAQEWFGLGLGLRTAAALTARGHQPQGQALRDRLMAQVDALSAKGAAPDWTRAPLARALGALRQAGGDGDAATTVPDPAQPLADLVICVYSCQPNLTTRVAAIRQTWMQRAHERGVPVLVFVGGGQGQQDGDVVTLDAPDDYESLPQKTLAMVDWVHRHTNHAAMFKIDDDCYVDIDALLAGDAPFQHDYWGRRLFRGRGHFDRTWHMAKSRSDHARHSLDKSPEPSVYADGSTGYVLSRAAMQALTEAAHSPAGQALIATSFMEDKLVGDLLRGQGVALSSLGYQTSILRHVRAQGAPVPLWENSLSPHAGGSVIVTHLDGHAQMAQTHAQAARPAPAATKIWPTWRDPALGYLSNALDLLSPPATLARARAAEVAVVACLRNERALIAPFLAHYRRMGVTAFLIADNLSDDGTADYLAEQPDVALFSVDTDYSASHYGVDWQQALMANFRVNRWSLVADADEFLFWGPDRDASLPALLRSEAFEGADAARVLMLDMYPQGHLAQADLSARDPFEVADHVDRVPFHQAAQRGGPFANAATYTSALRHRLIPGSRPDLFVVQKYALLRYKPWMRLSAGLHYVAECQPATRDLAFAHFKYHAGFHAKAQAETRRGQHFNDAEEYRKYLALLAEGRDVIFDPAVSVRWDECDWVRGLFDAAQRP